MLKYGPWRQSLRKICLAELQAKDRSGKLHKKRGIRLSPDQLGAFEFLNEETKPVMLIKALAGTGKSTIATRIVEACYETDAARDQTRGCGDLGAQSAAAGRTRAGRALHLPGRLVHGRFVHQSAMVGA